MLSNTRQGREDDRPVKRYLMEYASLLKRQQALADELDRLYAAATRATASLSAVGPSGGLNAGAREDAVLRAIDGEARLREVTAHIGEALSARLVLIERLPEERQKTLMTLRYISGWGWERIGYEMHYERTQVFDIHRQALEAAQEAFDAMRLGM